jgi:hypothetical protein
MNNKKTLKPRTSAKKTTGPQPSDAEASDQGKLLLDDWWLDASHNAMLDMARVCQKQMGHKPTLEDLRQLLEVRLRVSADEYFSDGGTIEVLEVVFKTKKKRAAQPYREGDVFAIPRGDDLYAFGRILRTDEKNGEVIEVFQQTATSKVYRASIVASGRMFYPAIVSGTECFKPWRWPVIHSDPDYRISEADARLEFVYPPGSAGWTAANPWDKPRTFRPVTEEERQYITSNALYGPEDIENRIRAALKLVPKPST